jgi:hypothetical protein
LNKGTTYDSFHTHGKTPESNDKLNKTASGFFTPSKIFFRISGDIPSDPGPFCTLLHSFLLKLDQWRNP